MTHPTEEEMVDSYYTGLDGELRNHLTGCAECSSLYQRICETLETANESRLPQRGADYGSEVWARLSAQLPVEPVRRSHWLLIPALAALLALVFSLGIWRQQEPRPPSLPSRPIPPIVVEAPVQAALKLPRKHQAIKHDSLKDEDAKLLALNGQLETDSKSALPEIVEMVKGDTSDRTKEHALYVLAQSNSVEAHQALLTFAHQSSDPALQASAGLMVQLIDTNPKAKTEALINAYRGANDDEIRKSVLDRFVKQQNTAALTTLSKTESDVRWKKEILDRLATLQAQETGK